MREMKSYRDPYRDIKRTSPMSGPWRQKEHHWLGKVYLFATIGLAMYVILSYSLNV